MKSLIILAVMIQLVITQRPYYLGGSTYPQVASRFTTTDATTARRVNNPVIKNSNNIVINESDEDDTELVNPEKTQSGELWFFWVPNPDRYERGIAI
ncbi:hypothetical protein FQR65_LT11350 [Abscondita terminalis]|nr:hypothetical protein FQR65_LT11350 [Abscondita terminalis]